MLLSCSYDDTIKVWKDDEDDWDCVETIEGHKSTVWEACFDTEGKYLASCSEDGTYIIWELEDSFKKVLVVDDIHKRPIYSVDWSKQNLIAGGSADDSIRIFSFDSDSKTVNLLATKLKAHSNDVNCVRWNPDGDILVSCSDDKLVKLWKYNNKP